MVKSIIIKDYNTKARFFFSTSYLVKLFLNTYVSSLDLFLFLIHKLSIILKYHYG